MLKVAVYGKGGIGKSTVTSNLAAAFAAMGKRVIQIGCDPKADSTINLLGGEPLRPVMNYMREEDEEPEKLEDISKEGFGGVLGIETGGPTPGLGCALRCSWRCSMRRFCGTDPGGLCGKSTHCHIRRENGTLCSQ